LQKRISWRSSRRHSDTDRCQGIDSRGKEILENQKGQLQVSKGSAAVLLFCSGKERRTKSLPAGTVWEKLGSTPEKGAIGKAGMGETTAAARREGGAGNPENANFGLFHFAVS